MLPQLESESIHQLRETNHFFTVCMYVYYINIKVGFRPKPKNKIVNEGTDKGKEIKKGRKRSIDPYAKVAAVSFMM